MEAPGPSLQQPSQTTGGRVWTLSSYKVGAGACWPARHTSRHLESPQLWQHNQPQSAACDAQCLEGMQEHVHLFVIHIRTWLSPSLVFVCPLCGKFIKRSLQPGDQVFPGSISV